MYVGTYLTNTNYAGRIYNGLKSQKSYQQKQGEFSCENILKGEKEWCTISNNKIAYFKCIALGFTSSFQVALVALQILPAVSLRMD